MCKDSSIPRTQPLSCSSQQSSANLQLTAPIYYKRLSDINYSAGFTDGQIIKLMKGSKSSQTPDVDVTQDRFNFQRPEDAGGMELQQGHFYWGCCD